jgi:DNA-directed RNA polymerase subunit E'/Rpb7
MFLLVQVKDLVRIAPKEFGGSNVEAVRKQLDIKLSNKVVPDLGLCVLIKSVDHIGDCTVFPGDGGAHCEVLASIVVYRPFEGEVLQGRVHSSSSRGIQVSLEFFEDIIIPPYLMKPGTEYDPMLQVWVWKYKEEGDGAGGGGGGGGDDDNDGAGARGSGGGSSGGGRATATGSDDEEGGVQRFEVRDGELIHFRVHTIKFTKTSRSGKVG